MPTTPWMEESRASCHSLCETPTFGNGACKWLTREQAGDNRAWFEVCSLKTGFACFQADGKEQKVMSTPEGTGKQRGEKSKVSHFLVLGSLPWNMDPRPLYLPGFCWGQSVSDHINTCHFHHLPATSTPPPAPRPFTPHPSHPHHSRWSSCLGLKEAS